jgi:hypothetical protein
MSHRVGDDLTISIEQTEQTILTKEISDDALEAAAGSWGAMKWPYTMYYCTALYWCPGP